VDLKDARFEADTLIQVLDPLRRALRVANRGDLVVVVATSDPGVAAVSEMFALKHDMPLFVTHSRNDVTHAKPVGQLTPAEFQSLEALSHLGGRVTVNDFARYADLEQTAAGNRLVNLARRGYVSRVPRSRREGDLYVSPAYYSGMTASEDWVDA